MLNIWFDYLKPYFQNHRIWKNTFRAENFRMVDIKINAETPGFTKPKIILKHIRYTLVKNLTNQ